MRDHLVTFETEENLHHPMELDVSELPSDGSWEIPLLDGGREIMLDGNNGRVEPTENIEAHSKEKGRGERIWEILNAHR